MLTLDAKVNLTCVETDHMALGHCSYPGNRVDVAWIGRKMVSLHMKNGLCVGSQSGLEFAKDMTPYHQ